MISYGFVESSDTKQFTAECQVMLRDGYLPAGGICVYGVPNEGHNGMEYQKWTVTTYYQAFYKVTI